MKTTEQTEKRYKRKICEVAKAFDAFCCQHQLRYFGIGGTAIGALRHGGIIPWDDDIDFAMPRPDYERFLQLCPQLLPKYDVFTHYNHPLWHLTIAKMCDAHTSYVASFSLRVMMGAFIDIFPMDGCPGNSEEERKSFFQQYMKLRNNGEAIRNFYTFRSLLSAIHAKHWADIPRQIRSHWYHLLGKKDPFFKRCDAILKAHPFDTSEYVAYFGTWKDAKVICPRAWFDDYYYADFEDFRIRLPKGVDAYLTHLFGDYMTPPPPETIKNDYHAYAFLDLDKRITWQEAYNIVNGK